MTTGEWLEKWYVVYVEDSDLAPSTQAMYRRSINALPEWLLSIPLEQITAMEVYRHVKTRAKVQPRAAQLDKVTLSRALKLAAKLGLRDALCIDRDTCPTPKHTARSVVVLSRDEARRYIDAATASPCAPLLLLCLCGLRRGEALGVRWCDIDLNTGVLHVRGQRQRSAGAYVWRKLKTAKSERMFALPSQLLQIIRTYPRKLRSPYLCDVVPERLRSEHQRAIAAAGLPPVTLHGLRHTMATLAASQVPMKELQIAMGHSSYKLTADLYADHLSPLSDVQTVVWSGF